jgi:hypothetical protein
MLPTRGEAALEAPSVARRLLLAVIFVGLVGVIVAAAVLVANHNPDRLYLSRRGYHRGGYLILFTTLLAAGVYALVSVVALTLVAFFRSDAPTVAAGYALANALALPFAAVKALGPWLAGGESYNVLSPRAAVLCCGWLSLATAVALVYWALERRVTSGGGRVRSALLAIAELLNSPVER